MAVAGLAIPIMMGVLALQVHLCWYFVHALLLRNSQDPLLPGSKKQKSVQSERPARTP